MADTDNSAAVLDVRDLIARFEELETELEEVQQHNPETGFVQDAEDAVALREEFNALREFLEELKGNGGDEQWRGDWYPVTLVRDSYFKDYARDLAEEIGAINPEASWPANCIDWDQAARELRMDYTSAEYDGVTYWFR